MKRIMTIVYISSTSLLLTLACKSNPVAEGEMPMNQMPMAESTTDSIAASGSAETPITPEEPSTSAMPEEPASAASSAMPDESSSTASSSVPDEVTKVAGLGASSSGRSR